MKKSFTYGFIEVQGKRIRKREPCPVISYNGIIGKEDDRSRIKDHQSTIINYRRWALVDLNH